MAEWCDKSSGEFCDDIDESGCSTVEVVDSLPGGHIATHQRSNGCSHVKVLRGQDVRRRFLHELGHRFRGPGHLRDGNVMDCNNSQRVDSLTGADIFDDLVIYDCL